MDNALAIKNRDIRVFFKSHDMVALTDEVKISYEKRQIPDRRNGIYVFVHSTKLGVVKVCRVKSFVQFKTFLSESATAPHPKRQLFPGTGSHGKAHLYCYALSPARAELLVKENGNDRPLLIKKLTQELKTRQLHYNRPVKHIDRTYQTLVNKRFTMKTFKRYTFLDDGSGFTFSWVSEIDITKGYQTSLFTHLFNRNIREERVEGSRQVIDMAKQFFNLDENGLRGLFAGGSSCHSIAVEDFESDRHIFYWREKCNQDFVRSIREHLLTIPDFSDVYPSDTRPVDVCKPLKSLQSSSILTSYYYQVTDNDLGSNKRHGIKTGFIQCRYTGYTWSFRTRNISVFDKVLTKRMGGSRGQFTLWMMRDDVIKQEQIGKLKSCFEATVTVLKNKRVYQSPSKIITERSYRF